MNTATVFSHVVLLVVGAYIVGTFALVVALLTSSRARPPLRVRRHSRVAMDALSAQPESGSAPRGPSTPVARDISDVSTPSDTAAAGSDFKKAA